MPWRTREVVQPAEALEARAGARGPSTSDAADGVRPVEDHEADARPRPPPPCRASSSPGTCSSGRPTSWMSKTSASRPRELLARSAASDVGGLAVERVDRHAGARDRARRRPPPCTARRRGRRARGRTAPRADTRGAAWRRSAAWTSRASTAVGLQTRPTRRPRSGRKRRAARTSRPERTRPARSGASFFLNEKPNVKRPGLFCRVGGIAQVPVGAGADVGVVDGVLEQLHQRRLARGVRSRRAP